MTREEVQERLDRFLALMDQEQALREELLALPMYGRHATEEAVELALNTQTELIAEIERLRHEEMLPILEEIAAFIGSARVDRVVG